MRLVVVSTTVLALAAAAFEFYNQWSVATSRQPDKTEPQQQQTPIIDGAQTTTGDRSPIINQTGSGRINIGVESKP